MVWRFYTADVFTSVPFGGNPLAVFPEATGLTTARMAQIAQELNLSETTFVFPAPSPEVTCRVRIFTPGGEIPFAGHPTVGTAYVLAVTGRFPWQGPSQTWRLQEPVGPIPVRLMGRGDRPDFVEMQVSQGAIAGPAVPDRPTLAAILGLSPEAIGGETYAPAAWSCGLPFLFVPLGDRASLDRAQPNLALWTQHLQNFWAPHLYLFTPGEQPRQFHSRMFAPALGIAEDPATGSAVSALGGYLAQYHPQETGEQVWQINQGEAMGRPSQLYLRLTYGSPEGPAIAVGGQVVLMSQGEFL